MTAPLLDAKAAGELLGVPDTWLYSAARRDAVPHFKIGRYVRFDRDQLLTWVQNRARGPMFNPGTTANSGPGVAATTQGPTPDLLRRTDAEET
jgi:excisionase family DNA binding protein